MVKVYGMWLHKRVVLILKNGFRKFGTLMNEDDFSLYIEFYKDKMVHPVPKSEISEICEDTKLLEVRK